MVASTIKERDYAIDIVKFIAVLMIINSHADICYPKLKILATGGAIGDCLFLFCSGFTLFMGKMMSFGDYYKRRIIRIYPSVILSVFFVHLVSLNYDINMIEFIGRNFIVAIMIYYVLLYFIRKYAIDKIKWVILCVGIVSLIIYIVWFPYKYEVGENGLYGITTHYRWIPYFIAILIGALVGMHRKKLKNNTRKDIFKFALCFAFFYVFQYAAKKYIPIAPFQFVTLLPLMGILFYLYKICNCKVMHRIYNSRIGHFIIMVIGGLCLESYLVQNPLFTDKMNNIWPVNLVIITCVIFVSAYALRCLSRLFLQTFREDSYNWEKVFSLY